MNSLCNGVTLIELMIAQLLGLVVIGGTLALFAPAIALYEQTSGAALVQDSGRLAVETLTMDIQQSGFRGCAPVGQRTSVVNPDSAMISRRLRGWAFESLRVSGIDAGNAGEVDQILGGGWNTRRFHQGDRWFGDILLLQGVRPGYMEIARHDADAELLEFAGDKTSVLKRGMVIGVSDCHQSTLLQLDRGSSPRYNANENKTIARYSANGSANCAASNSPGGQQVWLGGNSDARCNNSWGQSGFEKYQFAAGSEGFLLSSRLYYLSIQNNTDYPSLYRTEMASDGARVNTEIIVEGIENMRLRYGLDDNADGTPDRYVDATTVGTAVDRGWNDVVSVKLWLLVSSVDQRGYSRFNRAAVFPDRQGTMETCTPRASEASNACPVASQAHPLRRVFVREIMLRNPVS